MSPNALLISAALVLNPGQKSTHWHYGPFCSCPFNCMLCGAPFQALYLMQLVQARRAASTSPGPQRMATRFAARRGHTYAQPATGPWPWSN
jgi:hypothetical protein